MTTFILITYANEQYLAKIAYVNEQNRSKYAYANEQVLYI